MILTLALLFLIGWLAATLSGAAGFGGALVLLPILAHFLGIKEAVPVLTIAQFFGNASRIWFGYRQIRWRMVWLFSAGALPMAIMGSILFAGLPREWIMKGIGILLILLVLYRRFKMTKIQLGEKSLFLGGILTGFLSGIAGSVGPLGAAFFLSLELPAVAYIASEAATALLMHITKIVVYQNYALFDWHSVTYGIFLGMAMILGSWTGKKIIEKLSRENFILLVEVLLLISAGQLLFFS